jgi:hypothetical protein
MVFTNRARVGAWIFGIVAAIPVAGAAIAWIGRINGNDDLASAGFAAMIIGGIGALASTWLSGVKALRRAR